MNFGFNLFSTSIVSGYFLAKREVSFECLFFRRVVILFANSCDILSLLSQVGYFRGVV